MMRTDAPENDIASTYTMADALFSACFLNACLRHSDIVEIACFSPVVNTRGAIFVHPDGILKRTTYYTFYLYANYLKDYIVPTLTTVERLEHGEQSTGVLDIILSSDEAGKGYVCAVVNKDPERPVSLSIDFKSMGKEVPREIEGKVLSGRSPDDYNDIGAENRVVPQDRRFRVKDSSVTLPPHSLVFLSIK